MTLLLEVEGGAGNKMTSRSFGVPLTLEGMSELQVEPIQSGT